MGMGSSCRFPMTWVLSKSRHRLRQEPNTRPHSHPNRTSRRVLQYCTHLALFLDQPFHQSSSVSSLYIHTQVASEHHHSQLHKQNRANQSITSPASISRKKKETSQQSTMISTKRIPQLAKKWQRMAALGRKRLTWQKEANECCTSVASKGHCTLYTADGARFEMPLACLGTAVFAELLQMSQEEFGFGGDDGRITLPCDAAVMEYAICLLRRGVSAEVEKAFLNTMVMPCHYKNSVAPYVAACC